MEQEIATLQAELAGAKQRIADLETLLQLCKDHNSEFLANSN